MLLQVLLERTQERRATWSKRKVRHLVTPCQQTLRTSKRHKWPPDDARWLTLSGKRHATIVNAYASKMTNPDEGFIRQVLWWSGFCDFCNTPNKLILLGDFSVHKPPNLGRSGWNWRSRKVQQQWPSPFKEVCRARTTDYQHSLPSSNKTSWMHPRSKHCHLTDYVIIRRKDRQDVKVTRLYVVQTAGQITGLLSANPSCALSLYDHHKVRKCQRDWMSPNWNKTARGKHSSMKSDSLQRHRSLFSNWSSRTSISQTPRLVW